MTDASSGSARPPPADTPFAGLGPDLVLDALAAVGFRGDGRLIQLNSYENRVYQVFLEDGRVAVAKFYRPARWSDAQILEEHAFAAELDANELEVAAPWLLAVDPASTLGPACRLAGPTLACVANPQGEDHRFSVTQRLAGRAPELEDPSALEWLGRFIGRLHAVGARHPFRHRLALTVANFGDANRDWLLANDILPPDAAPAWHAVANEALDAVRTAFEGGGVRRSIRLHGDCHLGNVLWSDGPRLVDFDDAVNGPAVQDLWMLLSGDRGAMTRQLAAVLEGYEAFMDFDWRELRLIEPLRTLRLLHHSAWIARRWSDPAFPVAFPWFASPAYWAEQTTRLREQLEAMAEPPLGGLG